MPGFVWLLPGVLLPAVTLGVELTTRMNSETFFDPLPTPFHVLLVALVPAANFAAWWAARREQPRYRQAIELASAAAIGVSLFYAILFVPIVPLAMVAVMWYGMGLLPLTPLIALVAAMRLRVALVRTAPAQHSPAPVAAGIALGFAAVVAFGIPATITRIGLQMALAEDAATQARGVALIRYAGSEDLLLRLCYVRSGLATDMVGFFFDLSQRRMVGTEDARRTYYRVTGTPFNAMPAPAAARKRGGFALWERGDSEQGGATVAGKVEGLSLAASRLDGSVDGEAALGYLEWTMVFRNASALNREARAQIALPRGGVVSRLTLWIDGEEREAAFAGRGKVRQAYERIVRQNRDPVLVTTAGPDRVLMQLFPVPPGGEMKVRVGITLPLALRSASDAALRLPYFHERNFDVGAELRHAVWIESKKGPIRKELADAALAAPASTIAFERERRDGAWSADGRKPGQLVRQRVVERSSAAPRRVVVVIDGSVAMRAAASRVAKAFELVPGEVELELMIAADAASETPAVVRAAELAHRVRSWRYIGGHDNTAAIARALDRDGALLWITGPQPVLLGTAEPLLQRLERASRRPALHVLQVAPGPNVILEKLEGKAAVVVLQDDDLERLISSWRPGATQLVALRSRHEAAEAGALGAGDKTSEHLVRLWAHEEILRLAGSPAAGARESAVALAQRYQLVTPVSGAVVLETQQQYDQAGLEPAAPGSVPSIPEPEVWALLIAALLMLSHLHWRRRIAA